VYIFHRVEREQPLLSQRFQDKLVDIFEIIISPIISRIKILLHKIISRRHKSKGKEHISLHSPGLFIHANSLSMVFHLPGCEHYHCENCTIEFKDVDVAEKAGFTPCRFCKKLILAQEEQKQQ
jgi:lipopolysaccharide export system permease protein